LSVRQSWRFIEHCAAGTHEDVTGDALGMKFMQHTSPAEHWAESSHASWACAPAAHVAVLEHENDASPTVIAVGV
jgi:hypothetical protein